MGGKMVTHPKIIERGFSRNLLLRLSMGGSYIEFRECAELHSTAAIADV
jgi:hypothetical protein